VEGEYSKIIHEIHSFNINIDMAKKNRNIFEEGLKTFLCISCNSTFSAYSTFGKNNEKINTDACLICNSGTSNLEVKIGKVEAFYKRQNKHK